MSRKLTIKQEAFVLAYVETGNASEAYRRAYSATRMRPETIRRNAFSMLESNKITTTIEIFQAEHRARHDVTIDNLTRELNEDRKLARETGKASAAIAAVMGKAKLHGLLTDKHQITETEIVSFENLEDVPTSQLIAILLESKTDKQLMEFCRLESLE